MKPVNKESLKEISRRLMFEMKDEEYKTLLFEFDIILKQMDLISEIEGVDDAEPMTFPFDVKNNFLREDEVEETISKSDALKNSKTVVDGQISLPKVV